MSIREQIKKVAELLDGKVMYFDWKSYDFEEDIPHLIIDGGKRKHLLCGYQQRWHIYGSYDQSW